MSRAPAKPRPASPTRSATPACTTDSRAPEAPVDQDDVTGLLRRTAEHLGHVLDAAFDTVELVRQRTEAVLGADRGATTRLALTALHPLFRSVLAQQPNPLEGVGVAVGPGALSDTERWLEWWRRGPDGAASFTRHVLDPGALGFYDYQSRPWFRTPLEAGHEVAVGPYLDAGGCDVYTTTLATPLVLGPGQDLVVGGDLDMARLEATFLQEVGRRRPAVALLAATDRVVVSNTALLTSGSRVPAPVKEAVQAEVAVPSRVPGRSSWRLVALEQQP